MNVADLAEHLGLTEEWVWRTYKDRTGPEAAGEIYRFEDEEPCDLVFGKEEVYQWKIRTGFIHPKDIDFSSGS